MIRRAATSAAMRASSILAPASKSRPTNCFKRRNPPFKGELIYERGAGKERWTNNGSTSDDPFVKYTELDRFHASSKMELQAPIKMGLPQNDEPKTSFFVGRFIRGYYLLTPISFEDDGSLSPKYSTGLPFNHDICSCINGVFCYCHHIGDEVFVCNPTTMEIRKLPNSPFHHSSFPAGDGFRKVNTYLACWADPSSEEDDYKVIRFYTYAHDTDYEKQVVRLRYPEEIELYSPKTDSWKKIICHDYLYDPVYINGVIYFLPVLADFGLVIPSFDFRSETFSTLPFLSHLDYSDTCKPVKYNGHLTVLSRSLHRDGPVLHWVMTRDGEWVALGAYHMSAALDLPLGFARNDELLLFEFDGMLMVFDSTTGELKQLPAFASHHTHLQIFEFAETSVKLKSEVGEQDKDYDEDY